MTAGHPELACTLALDPSLAGGGAVAEAVEGRLDELMATLGVPGRAAVSVEAAPVRGEGGPLDLSVAGQRCPYPEELLDRVREYLQGRPPPPEEADDGARAAFLGMACVEIVKLQPAVLLGPPQAAAYSEALAAAGDGTGGRGAPWPPDQDWLLPVLRGLLDLRVSIADRTEVAKVLSSSGENGQEAREDLVAALRPEALELELPTLYLWELTQAVGTAEPRTFATVRNRLFMDLGIAPPPFRLALAEHLKPRTFACKVNHLSTAPMLGLAPGERREVGGETVGPLGYMGTALEAAARAHAPCLIDRGTVQTQLELLGQAFPALAEVANALLPVDRVTDTLRALTRDGRSTRDLRQILERLLDEHEPPPGSAA